MDMGLPPPAFRMATWKRLHVNRRFIHKLPVKQLSVHEEGAARALYLDWLYAAVTSCVCRLGTPCLFHKVLENWLGHQVSWFQFPGKIP